MSELKEIYECQDCGFRGEWVIMNLRGHGGRDCPKCGGEVDQMCECVNAEGKDLRR
jgi:predicted RNA-binding Zn-ribbon protein involved in translation (DUF1610 family)